MNTEDNQITPELVLAKIRGRLQQSLNDPRPDISAAQLRINLQKRRAEHKRKGRKACSAAFELRNNSPKPVS